MIAFNLDDLNEGPLRNAAIELGIKNAPTLTKAELIVAIKQATSPAKPIQLVIPPTEARWRQPALLISLFALVVSGLACAGTWYGNLHMVHKLNREIEDFEKTTWQAVHVYEILVSGTTTPEKWSGLTFEEIKSKYTESLIAEQNVKLGKKEMQPDELKKILQELCTKNLLMRTIESKYVPIRAAAPSWDCVRKPTTEATEKAITKVLAAEPGKYTVEKLFPKVNDETKVSSDDFYSALNCMKSRGLVTVDPQGQLWTALQDAKK